MAQAVTLTFSKFRVLLGDGATPEIFDAPCGFNARALNQSKNLTEVDIPDCDNEDAPTWVGRDVRSMTWSVTGEGVLAADSVQDWEAFWASNTSKSVKIEMEFPAPTGLITKTGKAHLATYNVGANRGERATINVEMQGDGELVVAP